MADLKNGIQSRELAPEDPMHSLIQALVQVMEIGAGTLVDTMPDQRDFLSAKMSAASMLAGAQFGLLLSIGAVDQKDTRRATEAATRNFREGIKVGLNRASRIMQEMGGAGHA